MQISTAESRGVELELFLGSCMVVISVTDSRGVELEPGIMGTDD